VSAEGWVTSSEDEDDAQRDRFDLLYYRLDAVTHWFNTKKGPQGTFDENQFLFHMRLLTYFRDHDLLDIFDLFDKDDSGSIGFEEFFLLLALLAARESGRSTQFLFMHGKKLFEIVSRGAPKISFQVFARIGLICGIPELALLNRLKEFNITLFDSFDCSEFLQYYFVILDDLDSGSFEARKGSTATATAAAGSSSSSSSSSSAAPSHRERESRDSAASDAEKDEERCSIS